MKAAQKAAEIKFWRRLHQRRFLDSPSHFIEKVDEEKLGSSSWTEAIKGWLSNNAKSIPGARITVTKGEVKFLVSLIRKLKERQKLFLRRKKTWVPLLEKHPFLICRYTICLDTTKTLKQRLMENYCNRTEVWRWTQSWLHTPFINEKLQSAVIKVSP